MRSDSQCLQHLASVVNSSASLVMKPFVHHLRGMNGILFLIEHLNVLEEFLNITISGVIHVFVRVSPTTEMDRISLIKPNVDLKYLLTNMPNYLNSGGLSAERKLYMYSVIQTCTVVLQ